MVNPSPLLAHPADPPSSDDGPEPVRVQRPRRAGPADAVRPTRAEINLANLRHNLRVLQRLCSPDNAEVWGVLKADAYGHGAPAVARTLERAGVARICVALLEEAMELRAAGIRVPILIMGGYYGPRRDGLDELVQNDLTPVLYDVGQLQRLASIARENEQRIPVHIKVDTGMSRLGATVDELPELLHALVAAPELELEGWMTHLACADAASMEATEEQLRRFHKAEELARRLGLKPRIRHAANSAALLRAPSSRYDAVRPGVALFGVSPLVEGATPMDGAAKELRPVMRVRSAVVALRELRRGDSVGYGHTFTAPRATRLATIPMGYADGLSRKLGNCGHVLIRGKRASIVGAVSMDMITVDVTDVPGTHVGDEAVLLGAQEGPHGRDEITADEVAAHAETISWEVLTSISRRVPRFFREP